MGASAVMTANRRGRPRAVGVERYPSGQIKHADRRSRAEREALAVAVAQPHRRGQAAPADPLHGYAIGRLLVRGLADPANGIDRHQHSVAERLAELLVRWHHATGHALPHLTSPAAELVSRGLSCASEPDEEWVMEVRRAYADAFEVVQRNTLGQGWQVLRQVVLHDEDVTCEAGLSLLKRSLNALDSIWRPR